MLKVPGRKLRHFLSENVVFFFLICDIISVLKIFNIIERKL